MQPIIQIRITLIGQTSRPISKFLVPSPILGWCLFSIIPANALIIYLLLRVLASYINFISIYHVIIPSQMNYFYYYVPVVILLLISYVELRLFVYCRPKNPLLSIKSACDSLSRIRQPSILLQYTTFTPQIILFEYKFVNHTKYYRFSIHWKILIFARLI